MASRLWTLAGFVLGMCALTVLWFTEALPILGNPAFNWLVVFALFGAGWWCFRRAG